MPDERPPDGRWTPESGGPPRAEADWAAFGTTYLPLFWSVVRGKYGLPWDEAEEVISRTWLLAYQKRERMPGGAARRRWLASVLCWKCRDVIRERERERAAGVALPAELPEPTAPPPEDVLILLERREILIEVLAGMPERDGLLIEGRYFEEPPQTYAELGRRVGLKEASVGPTLYRALLELGRRLRERGLD